MEQLCFFVNKEVWQQLPDAVFEALHPNLHADISDNNAATIASRLTWRLFFVLADIFSWTPDECMQLLAGYAQENKRMPLPVVEAAHALATKHNLVAAARGWLITSTNLTYDQAQDYRACATLMADAATAGKLTLPLHMESYYRYGVADAVLTMAIAHGLTEVALPPAVTMDNADVSLDELRPVLTAFDAKLPTIDARYFFFKLPNQLYFRLKKLSNDQLRQLASSALQWPLNCGNLSSARVKVIEAELDLIDVL